MVKSRLCETARLAFFSARSRLSHFLNCETEKFEISEDCGKKPRPRDLKSAEKTRLRDPWNSAKILRDPDFLKDHLPPLIVSNSWLSLWCSKICSENLTNLVVFCTVSSISFSYVTVEKWTEKFNLLLNCSNSGIYSK